MAGMANIARDGSGRPLTVRQRAVMRAIHLILLSGLLLALPAPLLAWRESDGIGAGLALVGGLCLLLCLGAIWILWATLGKGTDIAMKAAPVGILTLLPGAAFVIHALLHGRVEAGAERLYWLGSGALWAVGLLLPLLFATLFLFVVGGKP